MCIFRPDEALFYRKKFFEVALAFLQRTNFAILQQKIVSTKPIRSDSDQDIYNGSTSTLPNILILTVREC